MITRDSCETTFAVMAWAVIIGFVMAVYMGWWPCR